MILEFDQLIAFIEGFIKNSIAITL